MFQNYIKCVFYRPEISFFLKKYLKFQNFPVFQIKIRVLLHHFYSVTLAVENIESALAHTLVNGLRYSWECLKAQY